MAAVERRSPKTIADIKKDLLRPSLNSHFEVELDAPDELKSYLNPKKSKLQLLCSDAVLPGSMLATTEITDNFHGVTERHAYRRMFDDRIDLTFYVDAGDYTPIRFFERWINYISNTSELRSRPAPEGDTPPKESNAYYYRMRYPDDYMVNKMKVIKFEKDYQQNSSGRIAEYQFIRCFPIQINSMPISYDSSDILKCNVSMTYIRYIFNPGTNGYSWPAPYSTSPLLKNIVDQSQINTNRWSAAVLDRVGGALPQGASDLLGTLSNFG